MLKPDKKAIKNKRTKQTKDKRNQKVEKENLRCPQSAFFKFAHIPHPNWSLTKNENIHLSHRLTNGKQQNTRETSSVPGRSVSNTMLIRRVTCTVVFFFFKNSFFHFFISNNMA